MNLSLQLLRERHSGIAMPLKSVCEELGIAYKTGVNRLSRGNFPLATFMESGRRMAHVSTVADYLEARRIHAERPKRRVGRPTNASRGL